MIQNVILLVVVALAALYVGRRAWAATRAAVKPDAAGCGSACGCSAPVKQDKLEEPAAR